MERMRLYNDDCLNTFKLIEDKTIDLILIDPPYNISKAEWDKWKTVSEYIEFMGKVFKECERVLKDNGSFYFFHNDFLQMVELQNFINKNTGFVFKNMLTWEKYQTNKQYYGKNVLMFVNATEKRNYRSMAEYCLYYTFQDKTGLNKIYDDKECFTSIKRYLKEEKKKSGLTNKDLSLIFSEYTNKKGCLNRSVVERYFSNKQWVFPTENIYENVLQKTGYFQKPYEELRREYEEQRYTFNVFDTDKTTTFLIPPAPKQGHITPKPVDLLEYIIKTSSNEGDTVLDCFMGSGSTGVACLNTNRRFIGIEKDDKYFEIAKKRIKEHGNG